MGATYRIHSNEQSAHCRDVDIFSNLLPRMMTVLLLSNTDHFFPPFIFLSDFALSVSGRMQNRPLCMHYAIFKCIRVLLILSCRCWVCLFYMCVVGLLVCILCSFNQFRCLLFPPPQKKKNGGLCTTAHVAICYALAFYERADIWCSSKHLFWEKLNENDGKSKLKCIYFLLDTCIKDFVQGWGNLQKKKDRKKEI